MSVVTINGQFIGTIQQDWTSEDELYSYIIAWCVSNDRRITATLTVGSQRLHCLTQNATYAVIAGPDDGGWLSIGFVSD